MWQKELCLGLSQSFGMSELALMEALKEIGFDAFFSNVERDSIPTQILADHAKKIGLRYQSVHAPYHGADRLWHGSQEEIREAAGELLDCLDGCIRAEVPIMVCHAYIGFEPSAGPSQAGIDRYGELVKAAEGSGVKIAFENTEGEAYLFALLDAFKGNDAVGFCWDSGHEMCYNHSQDLLGKLGDRLIATHINDNLGIRDCAGQITWLDDLHLLPFDGIGDWDYNADRLKKCGYEGTLTFELTRQSKPGRHENDLYAKMEPIDYLTEVYKRACRIAAKL